MKVLSIDEAIEAIQAGALIAYPTEGVYGLGCDPFNETAVKALLTLKSRPMEKGLILVAASVEQLSSLLDWKALPYRTQIQASWPGPVTWTIPATPNVPVWIRGRFDTVAVRVSDHPIIQALCNVFNGPIVSTSANPSGLSPALSCEQVASYFEHQLAGCVVGELGGHQGPTPIYDARTGVPLRQ